MTLTLSSLVSKWTTKIINKNNLLLRKHFKSVTTPYCYLYGIRKIRDNIYIFSDLLATLFSKETYILTVLNVLLKCIFKLDWVRSSHWRVTKCFFLLYVFCLLFARNDLDRNSSHGFPLTDTFTELKITYKQESIQQRPWWFPIFTWVSTGTTNIEWISNPLNLLSQIFCQKFFVTNFLVA